MLLSIAGIGSLAAQEGSQTPGAAVRLNWDAKVIEALPFQRECLPLFAELSDYISNASIVAEFEVNLPEVDSDSEPGVPQIDFALKATALNIEGERVDDGEPIAFTHDGAVGECEEALGGPGDEVDPAVSFAPELAPELKFLEDAISWMLLDDALRWTLGEPRDLVLDRMQAVRLSPLHPKEPPIPGSQENPGPGSNGTNGDAELSITDEGEDGRSDTGPAWDQIITPVILAVVAVALVSLFYRTGKNRNSLETVDQYTRQLREQLSGHEQEMLRIVEMMRSSFEDRLQHLDQMIGSLLASAERADASREQKVIPRDPKNTTVIPGGPPPERPRASLPPSNVHAVLKDFNQLISQSGDPDEFAQSRDLVLFVSDRANGTLQPFDPSIGNTGPQFWVGFDKAEGYYALPGPDILKSSTNPAVSREKLRGFFRTERGSQQKVVVRHASYLVLDDANRLSVSDQGSLSIPV